MPQHTIAPRRQYTSLQKSHKRTSQNAIDGGPMTDSMEALERKTFECPTKQQDSGQKPRLSHFKTNFLLASNCFYSSCVKDWWALEILSALFSVACLIAIIVILLACENRPLSAWYLPININTLVSLFAALAKSTMLLPVAACIGQLKWLYFVRSSRSLIEIQRFDDASRGPLGALGLLFRARRHSLTAIFCVLVTSAAIAIDPFAQQIISYHSHHVAHANNSATIGVAGNTYDSSASGSWNNPMRTGLPDVQMQGAIYQGLSSGPPGPPFQCASGNCNWPAFASLGICSTCVNVTAETHRRCYSALTDSHNITRLFSVDPEEFWGWRVIGGLSCNYTTPQGLNLWAGVGGSGSIIANSTAKANTNGDAPGAEITRIAIVYAEIDSSINDKDSFGMAVQECSLFWCGRRYAGVRVVDGALQTGDIDILHLEHDTAAKETIRWIYQPIQALFDPTGYDFNTSITISKDDFGAISRFLTDLFTDDFNFVYGESAPRLMDSLASAMSDSMRTSPYGTQLQGTAILSVTFIHVQWGYLSLPVILIICTCALLAWTIITTQKSRSGSSSVPLWKSSSLALLFHGLEQQGGEAAESAICANKPEEDEKVASSRMLTLLEMEHFAKETRVQLLRDGGGEGSDMKFVRDT